MIQFVFDQFILFKFHFLVDPVIVIYLLLQEFFFFIEFLKFNRLMFNFTLKMIFNANWISKKTIELAF